jgi:hypothetical protein
VGVNVTVAVGAGVLVGTSVGAGAKTLHADDTNININRQDKMELALIVFIPFSFIIWFSYYGSIPNAITRQLSAKNRQFPNQQ